MKFDRELENTTFGPKVAPTHKVNQFPKQHKILLVKSENYCERNKVQTFLWYT